jgi:hypothetical protein
MRRETFQSQRSAITNHILADWLPAQESQIMTVQTDDLDQSMKVVAVLATCIVQTLNESDPTFQTRLLGRLEKAHNELRDSVDHAARAVALLSWVRELLTGFSWSGGQGAPFLENYS